MWSYAATNRTGAGPRRRSGSAFLVRSASVTDLLERTLSEVAVDQGNAVTLELKPFQVVTLRLSGAPR